MKVNKEKPYAIYIVLDEERIIKDNANLMDMKNYIESICNFNHFAKRMQMSQPAYLRYESGERTPSIHVIQVMADVLSTSVAYLTGQTNNPNPDSYLIKLDTDPELFQLIMKYKNSDIDMRNRLLSYFLKSTEEK